MTPPPPPWRDDLDRPMTACYNKTEEDPERQYESYHLRPVGRPVVGDSGTLGPRPTNCQSAYASCGGGGGDGD